MLPDTPNQPVDLFITTVSGSPAIDGLQLNAFIGDGYTGLAEFAFQTPVGVRFSDEASYVWDNSSGSPSTAAPVMGAPSLLEASFQLAAGSIGSPNGKLATLYIDTTGFMSGSFPLVWEGGAMASGSLSSSFLTGTNLGSVTFSADSQLVISGPNCDFSGDGVCDVTDIDQMQSLGPIALGIPASGIERFDLNSDGTVDLDDRDQWLSVAAIENGFNSPFKLGDANVDGVVDGSDFAGWNSGKFTGGLAWSAGNWNGDGFIDGSDFSLWNGAKFTSSDVATVPEAGTASLGWIALIFLEVARGSWVECCGKC